MNTIAAIATATGNGGIGIVRMSGEECFKILERIFRPKNVQKIEEISGYTIKYGNIINTETNEIIDEVLVSFFKNPKSYTTENMCEINSHGGRIVLKLILEECLKNGAILAQPGEFTKRAFLNGRIDLSQAESIMDLIHAKTEKEVKASIKQLEGGLAKKISSIHKEILSIMADIEASIDYPEYDIEEVTIEKLVKTLNRIKHELKKLEESFQNGKILREGIKTVIVGKPNAGKSSLLNNLLNEERAIVSEYAGTTRDTIEEYISIKGIPMHIIDTAGIRETKDVIEEIGVKKSRELLEEADFVIAILDNTKDIEQEDREILSKIKDKKAIILINKVDIEKNGLLENREVRDLNKPIIPISAQTGEGIDELIKQIEKLFKFEEIDTGNEIIITNIRHKDQIHKALDEVENAIEKISERVPVDIIAIYLKQALEELGIIIGENVTEGIIEEIFSKFCLGK